MKTDKENIVSKLLNARGAVLEALILATLLGLAINLFSGLISEWLKERAGVQLMLACGATLLCLGWLGRRLSRERTTESSWTGVVALENKTNKFIDLIIYPFSQNVFRYIQATLRGDPKLKAAWFESKITLRSPDVIVSGWYVGLRKREVPTQGEPSVAEKLIREAAEGHVLHVISSTLLDLASRMPEASFRKVDPVELEAISDENSVLRKVSQRDVETELQFSAGYAGDILSRPELLLPENGRIFRSNNGILIIETKRIKVELAVVLPGLEHFEIPEFGWFFLRKDPADFKLHKIFVRARMTVRRRSIFDFSEWWERIWIDELEREFAQRIDFNSFKGRVNFEAGLFGLRLGQVMEKIKANGK